MVGQSVGNYRIVKLLGEGGMGTVYLAEHPGLGRRVAVKVLHPDLARSDEMIQRFFNEARAANAVGHRGIVEISDFGILPSGAPYIVMELLDGERLTDRMLRCGPLPLGAAIEIAAQAASALAAAHGKGIVHRDLKPDNLFLIPDPLQPGRELLKVLDFGIAKLAPRPARDGDVRTRTGTILGTPRYMSPEQCRDSRDVDHRTDIYSLGVILYEMLSGTPPFVSSSWGELAHMHIGVSPPTLRTRVPDVPERIEQIVQRALEKDPDARFQSMVDLREALDGTAALRTLVLPEPGSTMRFEGRAPARATRRTTLASAASEVERDAPASWRGGPMVAVLVAGSMVAAVALTAVLAVRRTPEATITIAPAPAPAPAVAPVPATAPAPLAPIAAPAPAAAVAPAPPVEAVRAPAPATAPGTAEPPGRISVEIPDSPGARAVGEKSIARPARAKAAPRSRAPEKPAAPPPAAAKPPEPLKV